MTVPLIKHGSFVSHSGLTLPFKIDADALDDESIDNIAQVLIARLPTFGPVLGIPRGGLRLAAAIRRCRVGSWDDPVLIVDNVASTWASMEEARLSHPDAVGAVIFDRSTIRRPAWCSALFTVTM